MNELELKKWNEKISYEEGKIYYSEGNGYTSKLIQRLHKQGYTSIKEGSVHCLKDKDYKEVCTGTSWVTYLYNVAKIFA